jgi:hypothetical protein
MEDLSVQRHQAMITLSTHLKDTPGPYLNRLYPRTRTQASLSPEQDPFKTAFCGPSIFFFLAHLLLSPHHLPPPSPSNRHFLSSNVSIYLA